MLRSVFFFFQAEDGIRDLVRSRGLGDVYKRQPYAIDFMNPAPDMDIYSLTQHYFEWALNAMSDLVINRATQGVWQGYQYPWGRLVRP